jgi:hypothetical protein
LFAVQFACWSAMFLMWIAAWPLITLTILKPAPCSVDAVRHGMVMVAGCYAWYATLAAALNLAVPALTRRIAPPVLFAAMAAIGAGGLAALARVDDPRWLPLCFGAIGVGWCALANLSYQIAGTLMPEAAIDRGYRLFGFSTVLPQLAVTAALAFVLPPPDGTVARAILLAAAAAMALGSALAFGLRKRLGG